VYESKHGLISERTFESVPIKVDYIGQAHVRFEGIQTYHHLCIVRFDDVVKREQMHACLTNSGIQVVKIPCKADKFIEDINRFIRDGTSGYQVFDASNTNESNLFTFTAIDKRDVLKDAFASLGSIKKIHNVTTPEGDRVMSVEFNRNVKVSDVQRVFLANDVTLVHNTIDTNMRTTLHHVKHYRVIVAQAPAISYWDHFSIRHAINDLLKPMGLFINMTGELSIFFDDGKNVFIPCEVDFKTLNISTSEKDLLVYLRGVDEKDIQPMNGDARKPPFRECRYFYY
jgi:hypothetical protein